MMAISKVGLDAGLSRTGKAGSFAAACPYQSAIPCGVGWRGGLGPSARGRLRFFSPQQA